MSYWTLQTSAIPTSHLISRKSYGHHRDVRNVAQLATYIDTLFIFTHISSLVLFQVVPKIPILLMLLNLLLKQQALLRQQLHIAYTPYFQLYHDLFLKHQNKLKFHALDEKIIHSLSCGIVPVQFESGLEFLQNMFNSITTSEIRKSNNFLKTSSITYDDIVLYQF